MPKVGVKKKPAVAPKIGDRPGAQSMSSSPPCAVPGVVNQDVV
jgi:hypothetical protein